MKSQSPSRPAGNAGYSLIEVVIATWILTVVFAALFGAIGQGMNMIEHSRDLTRASQILQSELEDLRTLNFADLVDYRDNNPIVFYNPDTEFNDEFNERYDLVRWVTQHPDHPGTMIRVYIRISWNAMGAGGWQHRWISSDFTEDGLNDYYYRNV